MPRPVLPALACALAALLLPACGGGGGSDEDDIKGVIEQALTTKDSANCTETASDNFIQKFYGGSVDACEADVQTGETADSVEVTAVEIDGDAATAEAAPQGGDQDGEMLSLKLVNQSGDWVIDDATVGGGSNQLTDLFFESIKQAAIAQGQTPEAADCIIEHLRDEITNQELEALKAGDRPGSVSKKAQAAGKACGEK